MTDPRSYWLPGSGAIEPPDQQGFDAWHAGQVAAGRTERVDKLWNLVTMRRPIPSLPLPLGPSNTGLDLSHWNDNDTPLSVAQFELIKAAGHKFVWIKRTQGTAFVDRHGADNFLAASIAGGLWIGTMHFLEWNQDGTEQADHHSRTVGEAVGNFPELLDVELESGVVVTDKLLAETNLRKCLAALAIRFGRKPVIYTSRNYWEQMFVTARVMDILQAYKFLIADWDGPLDQAPVGLPWVHFRQKSATYQIDGIAGNIDLDEYRGDPPPVTARHTLTHLTNQGVFNLFLAAFGSAVYWGVLQRATDENQMLANRTALYNQLAIEDMPISDGEKALLIGALAP